MKRVVTLLMLLSLSVLVVAGCGNKEAEEVKPLPIPEPVIVIEEPEPEPESPAETEPAPDLVFTDENMLNGIPIIGVRVEKDGLYQSYLTGTWKAANVAKRRPMALIMPNNSAALPHYGISRADIIFEAAVEGRTTRIISFYEDYDDLEFIGPTRSARDYFIYEAMGKQGIFCNWGLAIPYCADLINSDRVDNISAALKGINVGADEAFFRRTRPGYDTEYRGYLKVEGYTKAVERLGYNQNYPASFVPQFTFAAEGTRVEYESHPKTTAIYPGGTSSNAGGYGSGNPYFEYHEDDYLYYRYQFKGKHIDEMNGEQLSFSNVVFQYMHGEKRDPNDYLAFGMHGEGKAQVFTNGRIIEGKWKRLDGDYVPAKFYDEDDNEIIFNQGKTWICLIWNDYAEFVVYN